jgi:small subunit ribosomal protein S12
MVRLHQLTRERSGSFRRPKKKFIVAKALKGRPQLRGVCIRIYSTKPKKPNSANRKVAKLRSSTGKRIIAYVHGSGHNLQQHSVVMVRGGRRRDLPGIHYQLIRGKYDFSAPESFYRAKRRSKFGMKRLTSGRFS